MPQRIQRKRTKGWRMPEGTVYVGRPSRFGNPFNAPHMSAAEQVAEYRAWMLDPKRRPVLPVGGWADYYNHGPVAGDLSVLRGRDLACWCPLDAPCHADVLLELANRSDA